MKHLHTIIFIGLSFVLCEVISAQSITTEHNNLSVATSPNGVLFHQTETTTAGLRHTTENTGLIFASGLWLTAVKSTGQLATSTATYKSDFSPGTTNWDSRDSLSTMTTITSNAIDSHKEDYSNFGYIVPKTIRDWPTHITNNDGSITHAAPFTDLNNNELYEPELGEYPDIIGNTFTYIILNDTRGTRFDSEGEPIGVDVYISVFSWNIPTDDAISNTVYANFKIINTSTSTYNNINKGLFLDFDLGNSNDDYVATDSTNNFVYTYNGDNDDDVTGGPSKGFGLNPPTFGAQVICGNLSSSFYYNIGGGPTGDVYTPNDYHNYLNSIWKDGTPLIANGDGFHTQGAATKYFFNGDPVTGTGWTEASAGNPPNDRRMLLGTSEGIEFKPGDVQNFTVAFSYARDNAKNNVENITTLRNTVGSIGRFLDSEKSSMSNYWSDNFSCQLVGVDENISKSVSIHPNPTTDFLNIENTKEYVSFKILSIDGKTLTEGNTTESIDVRNLKPGIYHLQLTKRNGSFSSTKFLKD
tara:strand:+ start:154422 stop:156002 length:1581 start_codon:yes stop_codon:yes gene_type:complete